MKKTLLTAWVLACTLVGGISCNDSEEDVVRTTIMLDATEFSLEVGQTRTLEVTVTPDTEGVTIEWNSSNPSVATVQEGVVTAVAVGDATITANVGEAQASCQVTVTAQSDVPVNSVTLDKKRPGNADRGAGTADSHSRTGQCDRSHGNMEQLRQHDRHSR
ncbi:MAG TPA: Ig-like domain-containing protein [Candidatus Alistipes avicola]|uniref:Ig-like domain-containing protein n=1 Tax=Candidatus Alistipes avicola TaxID=2838432 RepID=A0A9D2L2K0_9BACT|nr:Ig-like domain-containing protein [Candidatus Alistipes avicola]